MTTKMPYLSSNVISVLLKLYPDLEQEQLLTRLSSVPRTTIIRANTHLLKLEEAKQKLLEYVNSLEVPNVSYSVTTHTDAPDVLMVNSTISEDLPEAFYEKEVIVDTKCGCAVLRGADIFAPGVLAAHPAMRVGDKVSVYADLEKKCRRGLTKKFNHSKMFVGNGVALRDRQSLFETNNLSGIAIQMRSSFPSFSHLESSVFFPQNLPSIIVGHILKPRESDLILDMCAAPGGKTTHVATLMKNKGNIVAIDKTPNKVQRIKENCEKLRLSNVTCYSYDSTKLLDNASKNKEDLTEPPFKANTFDKIILDPPCSGLGQRPQLRYTMTDKELQSYPVYQRKLFKQAFHLLKPGGCLVYSTCTLLPEENEKQVAWALKTFPELNLVEQSPYVGKPALQGYGLADEHLSKVQRFDGFLRGNTTAKISFDNCNNDTIGFFLAKFIKI